MHLSCSALRAVLFLCSLISFSVVYAQKEPAIWIFGVNNGIDFRSGSAVAITNPNIGYYGADLKGVSTVTDANGNLLFYGEDATLYDRNHNIMQNGTGISGVWAATQTGLTVRAIHDTSLYYVFTINMYEINGMSYSSPDLWYSVVDMKANGGLGAVTLKNVRLFSGTSTMQLCAVRHCNERDIWIITHEWNSDVYVSFLVTPQGVKTSPVISHSGRPVVPGVWGFGNLQGYMKASPDGKKVAAAWRHMGADLSDFDNETGTVYNSIDLQLTSNSALEMGGVEFSPNSAVLYVNYGLYPMNLLYQYNLNAGSAAAIRASKTKLEEIYFFGRFGGMQRGPDDKIYVASLMQPYVAVINDPNTLGTGCDYELQGLTLSNISSQNFPAYIESKYYYPDPEFTFTSGCPNEVVNFSFEKPPNVFSVKWDFDDPASGATNTSTDLNPVHQFTEGRTYQVKLILFSNCKPDTLINSVTVQKIIVDIGNDTALCTDTDFFIRLKSPVAGSTYLWNTENGNEEISVSTSGLYWLQVNYGGCLYRDSIAVTFNEIAVHLGPDTILCDNATLELHAGNQLLDYTWQDGSKNNNFTVNTEGLYTLTVSNGTCSSTDAIQIGYNKKPIINLGEDKQICGGEVVTLGNHLQNNYSYVWEDGSTSPTRKINQSGTFTITASNECGSLSDDIIIKPGDCVLGIPNAFTPNGDGKNDVFSISKTTLLSSFSLQVYNRWGQKIFETLEQATGWNGNLGNRLCDPGHYPYVIQYRTVDGTPVTMKGMVVLIR